ncbi:MAG: serine acetyltransferase [Methylococcaceae bacterium]|nr:serine acetyltransferase [Methylococcaceae bacterium]
MSSRSVYNSWGISDLVGQLREIRHLALENRGRLDPPRLPSRKVLAQILEKVSAVLFPNRLGFPELSNESIDYYVGTTLDDLIRQLGTQIELELAFTKSLNHNSQDNGLSAADILQQFAAQLPTIRRLLDTDLQAAYEGDPAARSSDEVLVCYPGIVAITHHRIAHLLYGLGLPLIARMIAEIAHSATGIDIHPGAQIGDHFFIDHGTGVVIGETAIIGNRVRIYQAVTLGAKRFLKDESGHLLKGNLRHPIVEDDVVIYAGATILGRITIGKGSTIGGNVWLTHSVGPGSHIHQAQVRQEFFDAGGGI